MKNQAGREAMERARELDGFGHAEGMSRVAEKLAGKFLLAQIEAMERSRRSAGVDGVHEDHGRSVAPSFEKSSAFARFFDDADAGGNPIAEMPREDDSRGIVGTEGISDADD